MGLPPRPHLIAHSNPGYAPSKGVGGSVITAQPSSALGHRLSGGITSTVSLPSNTNTRPVVQENSANLGRNASRLMSSSYNATDRSRNASLPPPGGVNYDPNSTICREGDLHVGSNSSQQQWPVTRPGPNGLPSARVGPSQPRTEPEMSNLRIGENGPSGRNYAEDFPTNLYLHLGTWVSKTITPIFPRGTQGRVMEEMTTRLVGLAFRSLN